MSYLTWQVLANSDGRYTVKGTHNEFGVDPRYEVYQFQTLEWAALCEAAMKRLSNNTNFSSTGKASLWFSSDGGDGFTTIAFSEEQINALLKELTLRRVASFWLTPALASAKKRIRQAGIRLLWGENGRHK
jgi:hypothetical protein